MTKPYDLEERTFQFAKEVRVFIKTLEKTITNNEDAKQVIQASGPIGSNYIEANESLSKKDFDFRPNELINNQLSKKLIQSATELKKILSAIIEKSK